MISQLIFKEWLDDARRRPSIGIVNYCYEFKDNSAVLLEGEIPLYGAIGDLSKDDTNIKKTINEGRKLLFEKLKL